MKNNGKKTKQNKGQLACRIIALVLAFLMLAGAAYYTVYLISSLI